MTNLSQTWHERLGLLFSPARVLLNRLNYGPKFLLITVVLLIPFAYVTRSQHRSTTHDIEFNRGESDGVTYVAPLKDYLYAVQRHRVLTAAVLSGVASYRNAQAAAAAEAAEREKEVDAVEARFGGVFKSSARWAEAKAAWAKARGSSFANATEVDGAHQQVEDITADIILNYAANYSNLILDPDLDSYWLMDAYVSKLPSLGNTASRATAIAFTSSAEDKGVELAGLYKMNLDLVGDLAAINMKTAFEQTKQAKYGQSRTMEPILSPALSEIEKGVESHAELLKRQYLAPDAAPNPTALVDATLAALGSVDGFWDKTGPELKWLAEKRVRKYERERTVALIAALAAALLLLYLFAGFYLSVRGSVDALDEATRRMISGTSESFELEARDELGRIAQSYNEINAALLEARTLQKKIQRDNDELQENIMDLLRVVSTSSDGDLTVRARVTTGALGNVADAFNSLLESLAGLIGDVHRQVDKTDESIRAISLASQKMAQGATHQAREVIGATQLVQLMAKRIDEVSQNAVQAATAAKRTEESALEGARAVREVIGGMDALRMNVQAGAKKMKSLGDRSMEITSIVGTINRISEQTNMLALNAAIEAARAGEHGRGFSVVAEEVRKLAERTAAATQEIERLVKTIHVETNETVGAVEHQTQVVEQESIVVGSAGESLRRIQEVSTESANMVSGISVIAREQVEGTKQVVKTMEQISAIAQQTQNGAEGTLGTIQQLIALSDRLTKSIGRFKVANGASS